MPKTNISIAAQAGDIHWSQRPLLPVKIVAELLGVSRSGVYRLQSAEKLAFGKIGGRTVIRTDSVLRYLEEVEDWTPSQQGAAGRKAAAERAAQGWQS